MKNKLLTVAFILTLALGVGIGHFMNHSLPTVEAAPPQAGGQVFDPVILVHQESNGGPISTYLSHDPAVVQAIRSTPDKGCSPNGDTCYIQGSPYLTDATTAVTNKLYIGLNNPPPPAH